MDLAERIGKVDADWLFYFVLKVEEKKSAPAEEVKSDEEVPAESVSSDASDPSEPPDEVADSEEEEPPPAKKPKTVRI